jgi:hypothetical protein
MNSDANDLRQGFSRWPVGSQEPQAVAYLPPVGPNYPEGLLILASSGKCLGPQSQKALNSPAQILEQLDELAASIARHLKESKGAIAKLGFDSSPTQSS